MLPGSCWQGYLFLPQSGGMYRVVEGIVDELEKENVKIHYNTEIVDKSYYYVNVLSRSNPGCAPEGCESLFFVCPVPDLSKKSSWDDRDKIVDSIIDDYSARIKKDIRPEIVSRTVYTPFDWQEQFNLHRGSGLGLSHKMMQIGGFRPKNFNEVFKNVFYVGASTIPGGGLPMAVIGSRLVTERITSRMPSTATMLWKLY